MVGGHGGEPRVAVAGVREGVQRDVEGACGEGERVRACVGHGDGRAQEVKEFEEGGLDTDDADGGVAVLAVGWWAGDAVRPGGGRVVGR